MFDLGWSEMLVLLVVALIVIGPKDLPRVARALGQWMGKARAMAREFQSSLDEIAREAELEELKKGVESVRTTNLTKSIENTIDPGGSLKKAFDVNADDEKADKKAPKPAVADKTSSPAPSAANGAAEPAPAETKAETPNTDPGNVKEPAADAAPETARQT